MLPSTFNRALNARDFQIQCYNVYLTSIAAMKGAWILVLTVLCNESIKDVKLLIFIDLSSHFHSNGAGLRLGSYVVTGKRHGDPKGDWNQHQWIYRQLP